MAQIQQTVILLKISKLVRDESNGPEIELPADLLANIETYTQGILGDKLIVEMEQV